MDSETGAYTQTVEGMWRHMKVFLPDFGLKPKHLDSYLGAFMWLRHSKQHKQHPFIFFLECAAEMNRPYRSQYHPLIIPPATMARKPEADVHSQNSIKKCRTECTQHSPCTKLPLDTEDRKLPGDHIIDLTLSSTSDKTDPDFIEF